MINSAFHGNGLISTATTWGYTLRDKTSGAIMKFGQTINPDTRYSQKWLGENNLKMVQETSGTKQDISVWEHESIGDYIFSNGAAPALNNTSRSVNVFY